MEEISINKSLKRPNDEEEEDAPLDEHSNSSSLELDETTTIDQNAAYQNIEVESEQDQDEVEEAKVDVREEQGGNEEMVIVAETVESYKDETREETEYEYQPEMVTFEKGETGRGEACLWYNGYRYVHDQDIYWRCPNRRCPAKIQLLEDKDDQISGKLGIKPHNHMEPPKAQAVVKRKRLRLSDIKAELGIHQEEVEFEQGVTQKGAACLWHNGYRYVRAKDIYWRCSEKDCRTTAQLFTNQDGTGLIKGKLGVQPHNHAPQHDKQETEQRRNSAVVLKPLVLFPPPVVEAKAKRMSKCKTENDEMAIEAPEATFNNSTLEEQLMDLIEFQPGLTAMGGISLWHNGYRFISGGKDNYWRCSDRDCPAKVKTAGKQDDGQIRGRLGVKPHNHPPNFEKQEEAERKYRNMRRIKAEADDGHENDNSIIDEIDMLRSVKREPQYAEFEMGKTQKGALCLWHNGYRFINARGNYWRCSRKDCPATAQLELESLGDTVEGLKQGRLGHKPHNHEAEPAKKDAEELKVNVKRRRMYAKVNCKNLLSIKFPDNLAITKDGAPIIIYDSRKHRPGQRDVVLVMSHPELLETLKRNRRWAIDNNTSKGAAELTTPTPWAQSLLISAILSDRKMVHCAYALLPTTLTRHYEEALRSLKTAITPIGPYRVVTDYEKPVIESILDVFPNTLISGSFYHFGLMLSIKWRKLGLETAHFANAQLAEGMRQTFRRLLCLALLPPEYVRRSFSMIIERAPVGASEFLYFFAEMFIGLTPIESQIGAQAFVPGVEIWERRPQSNHIQQQRQQQQTSSQAIQNTNSGQSYVIVGQQPPIATEQQQVVPRWQLPIARTAKYELEYWNVHDRLPYALGRANSLLEIAQVQFKRVLKNRPVLSDMMQTIISDFNKQPSIVDISRSRFIEQQRVLSTLNQAEYDKDDELMELLNRLGLFLQTMVEGLRDWTSIVETYEEVKQEEKMEMEEEVEIDINDSGMDGIDGEISVQGPSTSAAAIQNVRRVEILGSEDDDDDEELDVEEEVLVDMHPSQYSGMAMIPSTSTGVMGQSNTPHSTAMTTSLVGFPQIVTPHPHQYLYRNF